MVFIATPESIAALGLNRVKPRGLTEKHFWMMIGVAMCIHFCALLAVEYWPREDIDEIPVRTMNIKLGAGHSMQPMEAAVVPPKPAASKPISKAVAAPVPKPKPAAPVVAKEKPKPTPKPDPFAAPVSPVQTKPLQAPKPIVVADTGERKRPSQNPVVPRKSIPAYIPPPVTDKVLSPLPQLAGMSSKPAPETGINVKPQQHVRSLPPMTQSAAGQGGSQMAGIPDGTPEAKAIRARYEQLVSKWLEKHKQYPAAAKMLGQQGQPVLRIRMDRAGNVKFSSVDKSSGYRLIDDAAMEMVKRANPFPRPPENYPGERLVEFLIPVAFKMN